MKDKINKHWLQIMFICIGLIFIIPFFIHIFFVNVPSLDFWVARWNAGNVLEFYGSIIVAGGTIILGYVAYWQTKKANEQADKANELSEKLIALEQNKLMPRFYLKWQGTGSEGIKFSLKNYSDYAAFGIEIDPLMIYSPTPDISPVIVPFVDKNFTGCLVGSEDVVIAFKAVNAIAAFNGCDIFIIKIRHSDLLDTRRATVITDKQTSQYKYSFAYKIDELPTHE